MKTNAMRILEAGKIPFELVSYRFDEEALDAIHAARTVGLDPKTVFKTIVLVNERKQYWVFCLPADRSINMKKARSLTGSKALELVKLTEIQNVTGYLRGGCSPIGMKRPFPPSSKRRRSAFPSSTSAPANGVCRSGSIPPICFVPSTENGRISPRSPTAGKVAADPKGKHVGKQHHKKNRRADQKRR